MFQKINSSKLEYYKKRVLCYRRTRNFEDAVIDAEKLVAMDPTNVNFQIDLIELLIDFEQCDEAVSGNLYVDLHEWLRECTYLYLYVTHDIFAMYIY